MKYQYKKIMKKLVNHIQNLVIKSEIRAEIKEIKS